MNKRLKVTMRIPQTKLLILIMALFWLGQYIYFPYQTPYLLSFGVSASMIGVVIGAYGFTQIIVRLPIGIIADKKPRQKLFIITGLLSVGIASAIRILFPGEAGFLIANLVSGIGSSMWISFMVQYSGYYDKKFQQKAMGNAWASNNMGVMLGFILATLLYDKMGMTILCIISAASAAAAIFLGAFIREPEMSFERLPVKKLVSVYSDRRLVLFALFTLVVAGISSATALAFTTKVAKDMGAKGLEIGIASIFFIAMSFLGSLFAGTKISVKMGPKILLPSMMLGLSVYCVVVPNCPSVGYVYAAQALAGVCIGILTSCCTAEAMQNVPPEKKSTAMGFFQAIYAVGMTFVPMLTGIVSDAYDLKIAYYSLAALVLAVFGGALFYYYYWQRKTQS